MQLISNFILLFEESAPFLLFGMLMAGIINQIVPKKWINKTLGNNNSVFTAAVIGAPLPLCSCSVIPVAMGIRRSGASKASTASFLVATPETGVDSIGVTYALMGPVMTVARPVAAIFSALITGSLVAVFGSKEMRANNNALEQAKDNSAHASHSSCCSKQHTASQSIGQKLWSAVHFGFGQLLRDFMLWFLLGLFFAALMTTYLPQDFITQYANGLLAMLVAVLISIPMYICATASTPIAVGLLLAGISPGAALVFMLTGPATNIATLMAIKNELGKRELAIYLLGIVFSALAAGISLDYLFTAFDWQLDLVHGEHSDMFGLVYQISAVILAGLIVWQLVKKYLRKAVI